MKSVGILTYHHYYNYGTMLQALALQHAVENCGYDSELIDFQNDTALSKSQLFMLRLKRIPVYFKNYKKYKVLSETKHYDELKKQLFEEFYAKYLKTGKQKFGKSEELSEDVLGYDCYVVGSDQTWNPYVSNRPEAFYLTFVKDNKKKGSYAPSVSVSKLTDEQKAFVKERLSGFSYLSCREKTGADLLSAVLNREVATVVDPTLLLDVEKWSRFESSEEKREKKYILVYLLGDNKEHREIVRGIQKKTGYDVLSIPVSYLEKADDTEKAVVGPDGFLNLIRNAEIVCTDSFHGTMFAVNYHKQFYSFPKMKDSENISQNSRLYDALSAFGLQNRILRSREDLVDIERIDYEKADPVLNAEREKSSKYLREMLRGLTAENDGR